MSHIFNPDRSYQTPPPTGIYITWDNELIYSGNDTSWTDVDGKVGPAVLILRIRGQDSGATGNVLFRKHGTAPTSVTGTSVISTYSSAVAMQTGYALVPTDAKGHIDIKTANMFGANVYRIGYWKPSMPRNTWTGAQSPVVYSDLDLGVANALCFLRIVQKSGVSTNVHFRQNGDTDSDQNNGDDICLGLQINPDVIEAYAVVITDSSGLVEWKTDAAREYQITLEAYVPIPDFSEAVTFAAGDIPADWTEVTSKNGRSLLYCKGIGNNNNSWAKFREHDCADDTSDNPGFTFLPSGNAARTYGMVLCNIEGSADWKEAFGGDTCTVTRLARMT